MLWTSMSQQCYEMLQSMPKGVIFGQSAAIDVKGCKILLSFISKESSFMSGSIKLLMVLELFQPRGSPQLKKFQ